jgi:hypothetical protein
MPPGTRVTVLRRAPERSTRGRVNMLLCDDLALISTAGRPTGQRRAGWLLETNTTARNSPLFIRGDALVQVV